MSFNSNTPISEIDSASTKNRCDIVRYLIEEDDADLFFTIESFRHSILNNNVELFAILWETRSRVLEESMCDISGMRGISDTHAIVQMIVGNGNLDFANVIFGERFMFESRSEKLIRLANIFVL